MTGRRSVRPEVSRTSTNPRAAARTTSRRRPRPGTVISRIGRRCGPALVSTVRMRATCSADVRAPVSIFAFKPSMPSPGSATFSTATSLCRSSGTGMASMLTPASAIARACSSASPMF